MLTLINNSMNIDSERKSELNPARAVSLRLLISVDSRSAQLGLFIATLLLWQSAAKTSSSYAFMRSANFMKGNNDGNSERHFVLSGFGGGDSNLRPELSADVEKPAPLNWTSMPRMQRLLSITDKLTNPMHIVKKIILSRKIFSVEKP